jgi:hypothetical protein
MQIGYLSSSGNNEKKENKPRICLRLPVDDVSSIWPEPPQAKIDVTDFYQYINNGFELPVMNWHEKTTKAKINGTIFITGWVWHQSHELKSDYNEIYHKVIQKQMSINRIPTLLLIILLVQLDIFQKRIFRQRKKQSLERLILIVRRFNLVTEEIFGFLRTSNSLSFSSPLQLLVPPLS